MSDIGRKIFTIQSSLRKWLNKIFNDQQSGITMRSFLQNFTYAYAKNKEEKLLPMKSCKSFQNI